MTYSTLQNILPDRQRCQREPSGFEILPAKYSNNAFGDNINVNSRNTMVKLCAKPKLSVTDQFANK